MAAFDKMTSSPMVAARELFGTILRHWFARNSWPQSITEAWAKSCGSPGPWASQISPAINGKLDPKVTFFIALGNFNQSVAERNVLGVTNERVRNLLLKGQPLCHDNGVPFGAEDFFKLFTGLLEPPQEFLAPPKAVPCDRDAEEMVVVTQACRDAFADVGGALMLNPAEMWKLVKPRMAEYLNDDQLAHCQRVLSGYEDLSPEIPASVKSQGVQRCMLVIALEHVAPEAAKASTHVARLDLLTSKLLAELKPL